MWLMCQGKDTLANAQHHWTSDLVDNLFVQRHFRPTGHNVPLV